MHKYNFMFFLRQSLNGLIKNGLMSATSIFILTACLLLTGCFGLLIYNINVNLEKINMLNKIIFRVSDEYSDEENIARIQSHILSLENTKFSKFIPKQEALDNLKREFGMDNEDLFDIPYEDNPLSNSFEIEYQDINKVDTFIYQLNNIEGVQKVINELETAEFIKNLKNVVMLVLAWFLVILFVIAIFIILNTVRLSVNIRKNEIMLMRYIGATNFFIVFPFLLEGIIIGVISTIFAYTFQWYIYGLAAGNIAKMNLGLTLIDFNETNILVFIIFLFIGVTSGFVGSGLSSRKYLKV